MRTTSGGSGFNLSVAATTADRGVLIGEADTYAAQHRLVGADGGAILGEDPPGQGIDAGGLHVRTCGYTNTCQPGNLDLIGLGVSYEAQTSKGDVNLLWFVARGRQVQVKFSGHGWRMQRVPLNFRAVATQAASTAGSTLAAHGADLFQASDKTPGASTGSVAVASPPCSIATVGIVSRGVGQVNLTGSETAPSYMCPSNRAPILASYSRHKTQWQLQGLVVGDSTLANEALLIIDTPRLSFATAA